LAYHRSQQGHVLGVELAQALVDEVADLRVGLLLGINDSLYVVLAVVKVVNEFC
jgi:hypothetical protein